MILGMFAPETAPAVADAGYLVDIVRLAPMLIIGFWSLLALVADAFAGSGLRLFQRRLALFGVLLAGLVAAAQFGSPEYDGGVTVFSGFLTIDHFSLLLDLAVLGVAAGVIAFAGDYNRSHRFEYGEQETLILIATFGVMMLVHASDLLAIFLGIETMSIAVYVLVGARWNDRRSSEAALKYFLMGAFSSGVLLMGIALVYGATGVTSLHELGRGVTGVFTQWRAVQPQVDLVVNPEHAPLDAVRIAADRAITGMAPAALLLPGVLLTLAALLFKASAVPFHMWTPDAYEGAPTPVTGFMAGGVKIGAVAALLKIMVGAFHVRMLVTTPYGWTFAVGLVALVTMTVGNLAAVRQSNIKRLLAFSSIAHVGYLLIGLFAAAHFYGSAVGGADASGPAVLRMGGDNAVSAVLYYVVTYAVATVGAFACVAWFSGHKEEALSAHEWAGLGRRHPGMALGMTLCLLSLMGMPPLAGFFGKVFLFRAGFEEMSHMMRTGAEGWPWFLVLIIAAVLNSVIGAYYYLRLIVAMYFRDPPEREMPTLSGRGAPAVVAIAAATSLALGVLAGPFLRQTQLAAAGFIYVPGETRASWVKGARETLWPTAATEAPQPADAEVAADAEAAVKAAPTPGAAPDAAGEAKPAATPRGVGRPVKAAS